MQKLDLTKQLDANRSLKNSLLNRGGNKTNSCPETSEANQRPDYSRITLTVQPALSLLRVYWEVSYVGSNCSVANGSECWDIYRTRRGRGQVLKKGTSCGEYVAEHHGVSDPRKFSKRARRN